MYCFIDLKSWSASILTCVFRIDHGSSCSAVRFCAWQIELDRNRVERKALMIKSRIMITSFVFFIVGLGGPSSIKNAAKTVG